jgi:hypothetical protein
VNFGDSLAFLITPDAGFLVSDVHVDSVSVGAVTSYTFRNISANHLIEASFAELLNPVPVLTSLSPNGAYRGETVDVSFRGNNFINGVSSVNVGPGIALNGVTVVSADTIRVNLTVDASATLGGMNFSVTNSGPGGGASAPSVFTVLNRVPTSPALISPVNGDSIKIDTIGSSLDFVWHSSQDLDTEDEVAYSIHLVGLALDTTLVGLSDTTVSWEIVGLLEVGQTYAWTVAATDGHVTVASPDTFWFYADVTDAVVEDVSRLPKDYRLHQNYPNPFNPTTVVQFDLPRAATVTLSVYNILGQEIVRLMDKQSMEAGYRKIVFDAAGIPSGAYLYRVFAEDSDGKTFVSVKRMIVVK